jgi:hypothetical protein
MDSLFLSPNSPGSPGPIPIQKQSPPSFEENQLMLMPKPLFESRPGPRMENPPLPMAHRYGKRDTLSSEIAY